MLAQAVLMLSRGGCLANTVGCVEEGGGNPTLTKGFWCLVGSAGTVNGMGGCPALAQSNCPAMAGSNQSQSL